MIHWQVCSKLYSNKPQPSISPKAMGAKVIMCDWALGDESTQPLHKRHARHHLRWLKCTSTALVLLWVITEVTSFLLPRTSCLKVTEDFQFSSSGSSTTQKQLLIIPIGTYPPGHVSRCPYCFSSGQRFLSVLVGCCKLQDTSKPLNKSSIITRGAFWNYKLCRFSCGYGSG